jgi:hypothetical protein
MNLDDHLGVNPMRTWGQDEIDSVKQLLSINRPDEVS